MERATVVYIIVSYHRSADLIANTNKQWGTNKQRGIYTSGSSLEWWREAARLTAHFLWTVAPNTRCPSSVQTDATEPRPQTLSELFDPSLFMTEFHFFQSGEGSSGGNKDFTNASWFQNIFSICFKCEWVWVRVFGVFFALNLNFIS